MFDFDEDNPGYCLFNGEILIDGRENIPISTSGACSNENIDPEVTNFIVRIQSFPIQNCTYFLKATVFSQNDTEISGGIFELGDSGLPEFTIGELVAGGTGGNTAGNAGSGTSGVKIPESEESGEDRRRQTQSLGPCYE